MCHLKPGPRCSRHTHDSLLSIKREYEERSVVLREAAAFADFTQFDPLSRQEDRDAAQDVVRRAIESARVTEEKLQAAQFAFDTTPDGQRLIAARLESGNLDAVTRRELEVYFEEVKEVRSLQNTAAQLQRRADKALSEFTPEQMSKIEELEGVIVEMESEVEKRKGDLTSAAQNLAKNRTTVGVTEADLRHTVVLVGMSHEKILNALVKEYMYEGIDEGSAQHYAQDSIGSFQKGWQFTGEDSAKDRVALFDNESFTVKTKGEGHEHNRSTIMVAQRLSNDSAFAATLDEAKTNHESFQRQVNASKYARAELRKSLIKANEISHEYSNAIANRQQAANSLLVYQAMYIGKFKEDNFYRVNKPVFFKSIYSDGEGNTNAFVLVKYGSAAPYYSSVKSAYKDSNNTLKVELANGESFHYEDLDDCEMLVVKPNENATKLSFD